MRVITLVAFALTLARPTFGQQPYFPPSSTQDEQSLNDFYSAQLRALDEPSLCCGAVADPVVVRFTWLRTFHHPVAIRMYRATSGAWLLQTKISDGAGGYEPGKLSSDKTKALANSDAQKVLSQVAHGSAFWAMPRTVTSNSSDNLGEVVISTDGADWTVEVLDGTSYHLISRHSPERGFIRDFGLLLISLSGEKLGPIY